MFLQVTAFGVSVTTAELGRAALAMGIAIIAVWAVRFLMRRVVRVFTGKTRTTLDDFLLAALQGPVAIFVVLVGAYAATLQFSALDRVEGTVLRYFNVAWMAVAVLAVSRAAGGVISWYGKEVASKTESDLDDKFLPILRRFSTVFIWAVGVLLILDYLDRPITPLVASLGIGGLAIALAFQPTLANFFAGTYVLSDGIVKPGDYIEINGGTAGTVQEIGWRVTRILTVEDNLVIIPNSQLADSVITDFAAPTTEINVWVESGVSYESDLDMVERVSLEVANDLVAHSPHSVKTHTPVFRFREFGDSNITFRVILRGLTRKDGAALRHQFIMALHARFKREGISINYPARVMYWAPGHHPGASDNPAPKLSEPLVTGRVGAASGHDIAHRADDDDDD